MCKIKILEMTESEWNKLWKKVFNEEPVWFLKGRLHFSGHKNPAPFPSMIVKYEWGDNLS